jgi:hypothetical protein
MPYSRKPWDLDEIFSAVGFLVICSGMIVVLVAVPALQLNRVLTLRKALQEQCGTRYSLLQVASSEDDLLSLCKMKNHQITVK